MHVLTIMLKFKHGLKPSPAPGQLLRVLCTQVIEGTISMSSIHGFHTFFTAVPTTCWQPGSTYVYFLIEVKKVTELQLLFGGGFFPLFQQKGGQGPYSWMSILHMTECSVDHWWKMDRELGNSSLDWRKLSLSHQYLSSPYNITEVMVT